MNYKSQLKGWAIDRVIEAKKAGIIPEVNSLVELKNFANDLAKFGYEPESDFADAIKRITEILKESPDALEKIILLQGELSYIQETLERQAAMAMKQRQSNIIEETVQ